MSTGEGDGDGVQFWGNIILKYVRIKLYEDLEDWGQEMNEVTHGLRPTPSD